MVESTLVMQRYFEVVDGSLVDNNKSVPAPINDEVRAELVERVNSFMGRRIIIKKVEQGIEEFEELIGSFGGITDDLGHIEFFEDLLLPLYPSIYVFAGYHSAIIEIYLWKNDKRIPWYENLKAKELYPARNTPLSLVEARLIGSYGKWKF